MMMTIVTNQCEDKGDNKHATIFLLFDLMGKNSEDGKKYSTKSFEDDTALD